MRPKSAAQKSPGERVVQEIRRARCEHYLAEDKIRIVLDGLRGGDVIAQGVGLRRPAQATAKLPSTRSRMAPRADCPERRAMPVTERYPAWI